MACEMTDAVMTHLPLLENILNSVEDRLTLARCLRVNSVWFEIVVGKLWSGSYFPLATHPDGWNSAQSLQSLLRVCHGTSLSIRTNKYMGSISHFELSPTDFVDAGSVERVTKVLRAGVGTSLQPRCLRLHGLIRRRWERRAVQHSIINDIASHLLGPWVRELDLSPPLTAETLRKVQHSCGILQKFAFIDKRRSLPQRLKEGGVCLLRHLPYVTHLELDLDGPVLSELFNELLEMKSLEILHLASIEPHHWLAAIDRRMNDQRPIFLHLRRLGLEVVGEKGPACVAILSQCRQLESLQYRSCLSGTLMAAAGNTHRVLDMIKVGQHMQPLLSLHGLSVFDISIRQSTECVEWSTFSDVIEQIVVANQELVRLTVVADVGVPAHSSCAR